MNPIKWAKQQVSNFLGKTPKAEGIEAYASSPRRDPHTYTLRQLAEMSKAVGKRLTHRDKMALRGAKWFFISTERFEYTDRDSGEKRVGCKKATYNAGKNKEKRKARGGASGKSARRRRIESLRLARLALEITPLEEMAI